MKKATALLGSMAIAVCLFTACKKQPPVDNLSSDFVVQTEYDTSADFSSYKTFAIRDTITLATDNPKDTLWYDSSARLIINEVAAKMRAAGYSQVPVKGNTGPDLCIQLVGIRNKIIYNVAPGYWWGYPGYADPCYWGNCNPYYYSYWYTYSIKTGTIVMDMADLKHAGESNKLNIIWTGIGSGQIGNSNSFIIGQCLQSVDQAFAQSPYLKTN